MGPTCSKKNVKPVVLNDLPQNTSGNVYIVVDMAKEIPLLTWHSAFPADKYNQLLLILFWAANVEKYNADCYFIKFSQDPIYDYRHNLRKYIFDCINTALAHKSHTDRLYVCHEFEKLCKSYLPTDIKALVEAQQLSV